MSTAVREQMMARPKGRPKKPGGEGTPVRLDSGLVVKARYLASQEGIPTSDYVSALLRPLIEKKFREAGKSLLEDDSK